MVTHFTHAELLRHFIEQQLAQWHLSGFMIGMFAWYCALFCIGLMGNIWVISLLIYIIKNLRLSNNQNIFIYILFLSCVDSLVVILLPILVSDMILLHWIFGKALCKIYLILESTNKMLSTFILAALSFDRYLAICKSGDTYTIRTGRGTLILLGALIGFVIILLMPVYLYAKELEIDEYVYVGNDTQNISLPKCVLDMGGDLLTFFTTYIFTIGFCLPSVLIICFYTMVVYHIYRHARTVGGGVTQIPVKRVTGATLMIVLFYFACWTPYWLSTMYQALAPLEASYAALNNPTLAKMYFVIHSFVYVNSSMNWVFYAFLNKNLRYSHDLAVERARSTRMFSRIDSTSTISTQNIKLTNPSLKDEMLLVFKSIEEEPDESNEQCEQAHPSVSDVVNHTNGPSFDYIEDEIVEVTV